MSVSALTTTKLSLAVEPLASSNAALKESARRRAIEVREPRLCAHSDARVIEVRGVRARVDEARRQGRTVEHRGQVARIGAAGRDRHHGLHAHRIVRLGADAEDQRAGQIARAGVGDVRQRDDGTVVIGREQGDGICTCEMVASIVLVQSEEVLHA